MFLFSNQDPMMTGADQAQRAHPTTGFTANSTQPDIHNIMQQNLMQNVYNYYNNNSAYSNMNAKRETTEPKQKNADKGNFSIERILSMPSEKKNCKTPRQEPINQSKNHYKRVSQLKLLTHFFY